jgi:integrase/recombinase XerD
MEADGLTTIASPKTVKEATDDFLKDAESRNLKDATTRKYRSLFNSLESFCKDHGLVFLNQLHEEQIRNFRNGWTLAPRTAGKHLERLKSFFRFCQDNKYIKESPAAKLKPPKVNDAPVVPFTEDQVKSILKACDAYPGNGKRLKALTELMLATGLRIDDPCTISHDKITQSNDGYSIEPCTAKTGEKVYCPIRDEVGQDIKAIPGAHPFWTGESNAEDCAATWRKAYARLFKQAGVKGHCHQFRHTYATRLLRAGVPLDTVSIMPAHASVKITQKHYAAWTKERREKIEAAIRKTWTTQSDEPKNQKPGTSTAHQRKNSSKNRINKGYFMEARVGIVPNAWRSRFSFASTFSRWSTSHTGMLERAESRYGCVSNPAPRFTMPQFRSGR